MAELTTKWRKRGYELDFGVGIAQGYATIGGIGFEGRWDYGAIRTVTNLASRLCGEAKPSQILVSQRLLGTVGDFGGSGVGGRAVLKGPPSRDHRSQCSAVEKTNVASHAVGT